MFVKTKEFIDNFILNARSFKILVLIVLFPMLIPFMHNEFGSYVKYALCFGVLICIWDLIQKKLKLILNDKITLLLILFSGSYLITIIINRDTSFSQNISQLVYMVVFFYLLFISKVKGNEFSIISWLIIVITFVLSLGSFLTYVFRIGEWYLFEESNDIWNDCTYLGLYNDFFSGLSNPNVVASIALISITLSLSFLLLSKNEKKIASILKSVFLVLNIIIQYLVIVFTKSDSALIATSVVISLLASVALIRSKHLVDKRTIKSVLAVLLCVFTFAGSIGLSLLISANDEKFIFVEIEESVDPNLDTVYENVLEKIIGFTTFDSSANLGMISMDRLSKMINSTGRNDIWVSGLEALKESPVFGLSREGLVDKVAPILLNNTNNPNRISALESGGLHNGYLSVLVSSGIVGFIILAILFMYVFYKAFYAVIKLKVFNIELLTSLVLCISFLVMEFAENRILYQVTAFNVVFWIYFGYLYFFAKEALKGESNEFSSIKTE